MAQRQRGADIAHAEPLDAMLSHQEPLDENEQYRIIREFEDMQLSQTRTFRTIFGAGAALIAAFFLYAANEQAARPWEVRYTGELRTVVTSSGVVGAFLIQATALAAAAVGLLLRLPRPGERERGCLPVAGAARGALAAGALGAAAGAAYWCAALRRSIAKYGPEDGAHWDLLWLPLAPLAYVALCWFVMHSVASTGKEIEKLRKMTYNYKAV
ncbi:hypothetical protein MNEG_0398 [Monoraphidium neglectum]|jgi:hypothetical protein|uniref:Uncharacterized protein n=1 Tax=Monoraphidium neglectum TaxID=145388 RepID=A0A0D2NTU2_9CHLO|nr:hypothetical protein MNEG_0398 [Monoraphidium neglectum]KIZ07561.1 hypothetical protein MNEG_0398 [Monoraphidium neglectum]|eukprot:XP_013906580.1 hypothetical protein MNEG_0398 [Monoraphidium neglectum]